MSKTSSHITKFHKTHNRKLFPCKHTYNLSNCSIPSLHPSILLLLLHNWHVIFLTFTNQNLDLQAENEHTSEKSKKSMKITHCFIPMEKDVAHDSSKYHLAINRLLLKFYCATFSICYSRKNFAMYLHTELLCALLCSYIYPEKKKLFARKRVL